MNMNKSLQVHTIAKMLEVQGIAADTVDLEALVDPRLTLPENITLVSEVVGTKLNGEFKNRQIEDEVERVEEHNRESFVRHVASTKAAELTVKDKTLKLLRDKPKYKAILQSIVDHENEHDYPREDGFDYLTGWRTRDIEELSGCYVPTLLECGVIRYAYKSSQYKEFKLVDKAQVEEALREFRMLKEEAVKKPRQPTVIEEDIKRFKEILEKHNGLNYWAPYVNPKVSMMERQKKAILLTLASLDDRYGDRHRIHTLLYGAPGTAKSELREWVTHKLNAGSCSHRSTDVGLTGDARGREITPGALPLAHGRVLTIDELDKFDKRDQYGLLECMSEGVVTITAGGKHQSFSAETRIIACANKIDGFSAELLDRFDFAIECKEPSSDQGKTILTDIFQFWGKPKRHYSGSVLAKSIAWVRGFEPYISDEVRERIIELIRGYIDTKNPKTVNVRQHERIMRIALAIARLNHRDLRYEDALEAIRLVDQEFDNHYRLMQLTKQGQNT